LLACIANILFFHTIVGLKSLFSKIQNSHQPRASPRLNLHPPSIQ
jgi:hypothetical protein